MKKILLSIAMIAIVLTLALTLASCDGSGKPDDTTTPDTTPSTEAPTETEHTHDYKTTVTNPTCLAAGFTTYLCDCGDTYVGDETAALDHDFGEWLTTKTATCTATGSQTRSCSRCDNSETKDIAIAAHQYNDTLLAPGKTTQGHTTHTCLACGDSYIDSYTNPTGSVGLLYVTNPDGSITITGIGTCTDEDIILYSTYYTTAGEKSVTGIAANAFLGNERIKTFTIPASVTAIGNGAFAGCSKLTAFTVDAENKNFSAVGGMLCSKNGDTIFAYPAGLELTTFTISASIKTIIPGAFAGCTKITEFKIADGNTSFAIENGIIYDSEKTTLIAFPSGMTAAALTLPDTVGTIGDYAFFGATKLSGITLKDRVGTSPNITVAGISAIGNYAFYGCTALAEIAFPAITDTLGMYAFSKCTALTKITFGAGIKKISEHCFEACTGLVNLVIADTVETIGAYAFYGCTNMETVVIGSGVKRIENSAFVDCLNKTGAATKVFFNGTSDMWNSTSMYVDSTNSMYITIYATLYFRSEGVKGVGNTWDYVSGVPTPW